MLFSKMAKMATMAERELVPWIVLRTSAVAPFMLETALMWRFIIVSSGPILPGLSVKIPACGHITSHAIFNAEMEHSMSYILCRAMVAQCMLKVLMWRYIPPHSRAILPAVGVAMYMVAIPWGELYTFVTMPSCIFTTLFFEVTL
jgi:hypothetical protein